jgi:hypothetical protein
MKTLYETMDWLTLHNSLIMVEDGEWTVEECEFDRQFLFDEYVAISHRYDLKKISLKS